MTSESNQPENNVGTHSDISTLSRWGDSYRSDMRRLDALEAVAQAATVFLALSQEREQLDRDPMVADATDAHENYREARDNLTAALARL